MDTVDRLRASRDAMLIESADGEAAGRRWAEEHATYRQLATLERLVIERGGDTAAEWYWDRVGDLIGVDADWRTEVGFIRGALAVWYEAKLKI